MKLTETDSLGLRVFVTVCLWIGLHASPIGPQSARYWNAVEALAAHGSFALLEQREIQPDVLVLDSESFSVIAPAIPIMLLPFRAIAVGLAEMTAIPASDPAFPLVVRFLAIALLNGPLMGAAAALLYRTIRDQGAPAGISAGLAILAFAGSPVTFYASQGIWAHGYSAAILVAAFAALSRQNPWLSGLLLGLAVLVDYANAIPALVLGTVGVVGFTRARDPRRIAAFVAAMLPAAALMIVYHLSVTGVATLTPQAAFAEQRRALLGPEAGALLQLPGVEAFLGLTISLERGLLIYFPISLLFVATGFVRPAAPRLATCWILFLFCIAFTASYSAWHGHSAFGPRHLVPLVPFLVIPCTHFPRLALASLGGLSFFIAWAGLATGPSSSIEQNLGVFLIRGPFLHWLDLLHQEVLPVHYGIELYRVTPFFLYVSLGLLLYWVWRPALRSASSQTEPPGSS